MGSSNGGGGGRLFSVLVRGLFIFFSQLLLLRIGGQSLATTNGSHVSEFQGTIYFAGCALGKALRPYHNEVRANILRVARLWTDYRICMYADDGAAKLLQSWNDPRVEIIWQSRHQRLVPPANNWARTERLAIGRNACLNLIRGMIIKTNYTLEGSYFISLDVDDINASPIKIDVIREVMQHTHEWDVVTFNREPYYDFWALRWKGYDKNIEALGGFIADGRDEWREFSLHKEFGKSVLNNSTQKWIAVYSAFDGFAIYKLNYTNHCHYDGKHHWAMNGSNRTGYVEDCEHVQFHKCMTKKNGAKVRVYNKLYLNASEKQSKEDLTTVLKNS